MAGRGWACLGGPWDAVFDEEGHVEEGFVVVVAHNLLVSVENGEIEAADEAGGLLGEGAEVDGVEGSVAH
jgi:hypothetical protein